MQYLIPDTKKKTKFLGNLTAKDLLIIVIAIVLLALVLSSSIPWWLQLIISLIILIVTVISVITIDTQKGWRMLWNFFKFITRSRNWPEESISSEMEITDIVHLKGGHYSAVIQLNGIDVSILSTESQDSKIMAFMAMLKELNYGKIIKMEEPIDFKPYIGTNNMFIAACEQKLKEKARAKWGNNPINWQSQEREPEYLKKTILENQNLYLNKFSTISQTYKSTFYLVIQESNEENIRNLVAFCCQSLKNIGIFKKQLVDTNDKKELSVFIKRSLSFSKEVVEQKDIKFMAVREKATKLIVGNQAYRTICIHKYKMLNDNAWAWKLFNIPDVKVTINFRPYAGKSVEKLFDRQFSELRMRLEDSKVKEYQRNELQGEYQTMQALVTDLQFGFDKMFDIEFYLTYPVQLHKEVLRQVRSMGLKASDLFLEQYENYLSTLPFTVMTDKKVSETINSVAASAISGMFPFVIKELFDNNGSYLGGSSGLPVFLNLFHRDEDRKNSNIVIFGTSGGGKSYFLKKELLQFYTQNKKIFILDPDNEYRRFHEIFNVDYIDLAGLQDQQINPLQVFPAFSEDEDGKAANEVSSHMLFLEQFFDTVLPGLEQFQKDLLLNYISELYASKGIKDGVKVSELPVEAYPTFDELEQLIKNRQAELIKTHKPEDEYELKNISPLLMAVNKFTEGGLYSSLWNGYTTLTIRNDFTVFNFQSLFATNNSTVVNGQMLLVIKYLNQEVIKNRQDGQSNIVIAIDEAHRFINGEFTVGLDFMQQEAKQIRKYYGSLIVATQNIDDFCGVSPEMRQKAAAVINCCQYSFVFNLAPDDINRITELYKNYNGGLQKEEVNYISTARKGDCLFIASKDIRLPVHITTFPGENYYFEKLDNILTA